MTGIPLPDIKVRFYDEHRTHVPDTYDKRFAEMDIDSQCRELQEVDQKIVDELAVEKPALFVESEKKARQFWARLGIVALPDIFLLEEGEMLSEVEEFEDELTVAVSTTYTNVAFVRQKVADAMVETAGPKSLEKLLVHELAHLTGAEPKLIGVQSQGKKRYDMCYQSGFITTSRHTFYGTFLEEGFATLMHGWYHRSLEDPEAPSIGITGQPDVGVPFYLAPHNPLMRSGPDGYGVELLAWGAEQRDIMSASDFTSNLLATRVGATEIKARRILARTIEAIQPDLYRKLRVINYVKEEIMGGCQLIYEAVTK